MIDGLAHAAHNTRILITILVHTLRKRKRADSSFWLYKLDETLGQLKSLHLVPVVAPR